MRGRRIIRFLLAASVCVGGCKTREKSSTPAPSTPSTPATEPSATTTGARPDPELVEEIAKGELFTPHELARLGKSRELAPSLVGAFESRAPAERERLVDFLTSLGKSADPAGLSVLRSDVVRALVTLLGDDDDDVRGAAARSLVENVPDDLVRNHAQRIVAVIQANPKLPKGAMLLGMVGSKRALELIDEGAVAGESPEVLDVVRAKLGDSAAEDRTLKRYREAVPRKGDLHDVERWTELLGYLATPRAVQALARDLRHPGVFPWGHGSQRMVRAAVVRALAMAFPRDAHPHLVEPESQAGFERVEKWAENQLGVTWSEPRPDYVHQAPSVTY